MARDSTDRSDGTSDSARCRAAAVLAGGGSRRMGFDKALAELSSGTLLGRAVGLVRPLVDRVLVIGRRVDPARLPDVEGHLDAHPQAGPLGGIVTALEHSRPDSCLIIPCDMPLLGRDLLERLIDLHTPAMDCTLLVNPLTERWEPLVGVYGARCLPALTEAIEEGRLAIWRTLVRLEVQRVAVPHEQAGRLLNLNTPGDLRRFGTLE